MCVNSGKSGDVLRVIQDFFEKLGSKSPLANNNIINKKGRIFLVNKNLYEYSKMDFFYAGLYLGNIKKGKIIPSLYLLSFLSKNKANKVIVDNKTAWLFIYGKNIFSEGILRVDDPLKKGDLTLILNSYDDCLGLGKLLDDLNKKSTQNKVIIENLFDIGDFLRRES